MERIEPGLGNDGDQSRRDLQFVVLGLLGDQVGQRVGESGRLATGAARGDQCENDRAEEVGKTLAASVAGVMPGAAVPEAGLAGDPS